MDASGSLLVRAPGPARRRGRARRSARRRVATTARQAAGSVRPMAFQVIPALDVFGGRLARFTPAGPEPVSAFGGDPLAAAGALAGGRRHAVPRRRHGPRVRRASRPDSTCCGRSSGSACPCRRPADRGPRSTCDAVLAGGRRAGRAGLGGARRHGRRDASLIGSFGDRLVVGHRGRGRSDPAHAAGPRPTWRSPRSSTRGRRGRGPAPGDGGRAGGHARGARPRRLAARDRIRRAGVGGRRDRIDRGAVGRQATWGPREPWSGGPPSTAGWTSRRRSRRSPTASAADRGR